MRAEEDQLEMAKWVLERNLHWVGAAEVKTAVIATVDVAMLGALTAAFSVVAPDSREGWPMIFSVPAGVCLMIALFCAAMSVLPRTDGPPTSFVFFGKIVKYAAPDYAEAFRKASTGAFLKDLFDQIHRNAEIACNKFRWVRRSMLWSFVALVPWVLALACLLRAARPPAASP